MYPIIRRYASYYGATGVQPSTAAQCAEKLDRMFRTISQQYGVIFHDDHIEGLTPQVLTDFYISLADAGRTMTTRNNYVSFLNPFLLWAFKNELLPKDLSGVLSTHKLPRRDMIPESDLKPKSLTDEQARQLLQTRSWRKANDVRDRAIIALFLYSGIRVSELCSLTLSSLLDQPEGLIYLKRKGGSWKHTEVGKQAMPYIEAYLATRTDLADHSRPLFLTSSGLPFDRKKIYKLLSYRQKTLGLPTGPHSLRHTFVTKAEHEAGSSLARDLANHSSLTITNRYTHTTPEERRAAVDSFVY